MLTFISTLTQILTFTTGDFVVYCFVNENILVRSHIQLLFTICSRSRFLWNCLILFLEPWALLLISLGKCWPKLSHKNAQINTETYKWCIAYLVNEHLSWVNQPNLTNFANFTNPPRPQLYVYLGVHVQNGEWQQTK